MNPPNLVLLAPRQRSSKAQSESFDVDQVLGLSRDLKEALFSANRAAVSSIEAVLPNLLDAESIVGSPQNSKIGLRYYGATETLGQNVYAFLKAVDTLTDVILEYEEVPSYTPTIISQLTGMALKLRSSQKEASEQEEYLDAAVEAELLVHTVARIGKLKEVMESIGVKLGNATAEELIKEVSLKRTLVAAGFDYRDAAGAEEIRASDAEDYERALTYRARGRIALEKSGLWITLEDTGFDRRMLRNRLIGDCSDTAAASLGIANSKDEATHQEVRDVIRRAIDDAEARYSEFDIEAFEF